MSSSISSPRLRAAVLAVTLAGSGLWAAAPSAHAATLGLTQSGGSVAFDDDPIGGAICNQSGTGNVESTPPGTFAANGVPVTSTASSSAVITNAGSAADATSMSGNITSTVTGTGVGGQLTTVHLVANASATLTTGVAATKCGASVQVGGGAMFQFDLAAPTLVTITGEGHHLTGIAQVGDLSGNASIENDIDGVVAFAIGRHGTSTASTVLAAGPARAGVVQIESEIDAPDTATTLSSSGDVTLDITFSTPGVADTTQSGSAGKYVALGAGRTCASGSLPLTWSKKAGAGKNRVVKKAVVKVNGAKVATIKKPKKNQVSTITGLDAEKAADVEVSFKIKGKGKLSVERSYLRCS
jgi:hypothetical protein